MCSCLQLRGMHTWPKEGWAPGSAGITDIKKGLRLALALVLSVFGGEPGIRTLGTLSRSPVFKTGAFNHSANSPMQPLEYPEVCIWGLPEIRTLG